MSKEKNKASHFETHLKLKPKQIFNRIEELKANNESMISYKLFDEYPDEVITEKFELSSLAAKGFKIYEVSSCDENFSNYKSLLNIYFNPQSPLHTIYNLL